MSQKITSAYDAPILSGDLNEKFKDLLRSGSKCNWFLSGPNDSTLLKVTFSGGIATIALNGLTTLIKLFIDGAYDIITDNTSVFTTSGNVTNVPIYVVYTHNNLDITQRMKLFIGSVSNPLPDNYLLIGTITIDISSESSTFTIDPNIFTPGILKPPTETEPGNNYKFIIYNPILQKFMLSEFDGNSFAPHRIMKTDPSGSVQVEANTVWYADTANKVITKGIKESMIDDNAVTTTQIKDGTIQWQDIDNSASTGTKIIRHGTINGVRFFVGSVDPATISGNNIVPNDIWIKT